MTTMLKVIDINHDDVNHRLAVTFRGTENKDFFLAQEIFRALISTNFCVESGFGYNDNLQEILVFKYPKSKDITLLYEAQFGRYGATWIKDTRKKIQPNENDR